MTIELGNGWRVSIGKTQWMLSSGAIQVGDRAHIAARGIRSCAALGSTAAAGLI
jgi:hypothetical protein